MVGTAVWDSYRKRDLSGVPPCGGSSKCADSGVTGGSAYSRNSKEASVAGTP